MPSTVECKSGATGGPAALSISGIYWSLRQRKGELVTSTGEDYTVSIHFQIFFSEWINDYSPKVEDISFLSSSAGMRAKMPMVKGHGSHWRVIHLPSSDPCCPISQNSAIDKEKNWVKGLGSLGQISHHRK